jgi:anti-anti-sigma regulatory factor
MGGHVHRQDTKAERRCFVAQPVQVGPFAVEVSPTQIRFRFADPDAITLEIPSSLEKDLLAFVERHRADAGGRRCVIDLQDLTALSSRQLGMMLAVRKVCQPLGPLDLERVSGSVRQLLDLTRMAGYFNLPH